MKLGKAFFMGGLLTVLAASGAAGAPAALASSPPGGICNPGCEANVEFRSHGEVFTVHDYAKDGHSTVGLLDWYADGSWHRLDTLWNSKGFNASPVVRNYSIPEGVKIRYAACLGESPTGKIFDCSGWHRDKT
jgi:hypothetical protein